MIKVRTTMQPDRDTEVPTSAELKDLRRQGLLVEDQPGSNRTPAITGNK